jgi:hypothetical protein
VFFDEDFWTVESQKAVEFHNKVIMPELLGSYFTKDKVNVESWCVCGNGSLSGEATEAGPHPNSSMNLNKNLFLRISIL